MTSVTESWFIVSVPVLSRQRTSRDAASSMESRRVTSTPFLTSSMAPTACTIVRTAGRATGTAPMRKITAKAATVRIPIFKTSAPAATAASAAIPRYIMYLTMDSMICSWWDFGRAIWTSSAVLPK